MVNVANGADVHVGLATGTRQPKPFSEHLRALRRTLRLSKQLVKL